MNFIKGLFGFIPILITAVILTFLTWLIFIFDFRYKKLPVSDKMIDFFDDISKYLIWEELGIYFLWFITQIAFVISEIDYIYNRTTNPYEPFYWFFSLSLLVTVIRYMYYVKVIKKRIEKDE